MKEQLEKDLRKYKWFIVWSVLGFIFSLVFVVYFFMQNDNRSWGFVAILAADIYELQRDIRRYHSTSVICVLTSFPKSPLKKPVTASQDVSASVESSITATSVSDKILLIMFSFLL